MPTQIRSTRDGLVQVDGYRQDLAVGETIAVSLSDNTGVRTYKWQLIGRPELSVAGGAGPEPVLLGRTATASFVVDSDVPSGRDGSYLVSCLVNEGLPTQAEYRAVLARLASVALLNGKTLRIPAFQESAEDTQDAGINAGWAKHFNRWCRYSLEMTTSGTGPDFMTHRVGDGIIGDVTTSKQDRVYLAGQQRAGSNVVYAAHYTVNRLVAIPVLFPKMGTFKSIVQRTSDAIGTVLCGLYDNTSYLYPGRLRCAVEFSTAVASTRHDVDVNQPIVPGMYWAVTMGSSAAIKQHNINAYDCYPFLGWIGDLSNIYPGVAIRHDYAWTGALPAQFPQSAPTVINADLVTVLPSFFFRWRG